MRRLETDTRDSGQTEPGARPTSAYRHRRKARAQAIVEFAFAAPIFFFWLMVTIQLALLFIQHYSVQRTTRETARWLAINSDATDAMLVSHVTANPLPGLIAARFQQVAATPACASLTNGRCAARVPGEMVSVQIQYNATDWIFLPTEYHLGDLHARIPIDLIAYQVAVMIE